MSPLPGCFFPVTHIKELGPRYLVAPLQCSLYGTPWLCLSVRPCSQSWQKKICSSRVEKLPPGSISARFCSTFPWCSLIWRTCPHLSPVKKLFILRTGEGGGEGGREGGRGCFMQRMTHIWRPKSHPLGVGSLLSPGLEDLTVDPRLVHQSHLIGPGIIFNKLLRATLFFFHP